MTVLVPPRKWLVAAFASIVAVAVLLWTANDGRVPLPQQARFRGGRHVEYSGSKHNGSDYDHRGPADIENARNDTLGFGKILVINLPSRTDRADAIALSMAALGLKYEIVPGVDGAVSDRAIPPPLTHTETNGGVIGCWRSHLNAYRYIVESGVETALILEDDIDWDVRIRDLMRDYALSVRALTQPLDTPDSPLTSYADPTFPDPAAAHLPDDAPMPQFPFYNLPSTKPPTRSPYGDNWDMLWPGNCAAEMADTLQPFKRDRSRLAPRGRVVHYDDPSVVAGSHMEVMFQREDVRNIYPPQTRVVHHSIGGVCLYGYALTREAAARMIMQMGIDRTDGPVDNMIADICAGVNGRAKERCIAVSPPLFWSHIPRKNMSLISSIASLSDHRVVDKPYTRNVQWSVRLNLAKLFTSPGRPVPPFEDQWPIQQVDKEALERVREERIRAGEEGIKVRESGHGPVILN